MRKEFNNLVETMRKWDLYQSDDEVSISLDILNKKIEEVEKRLQCVDKITRDIDVSISEYTEMVDNNESFKMNVNNHDRILIGSHDITIAIDLNDNEPIENNWYDLFTPINKV